MPMPHRHSGSCIRESDGRHPNKRLVESIHSWEFAKGNRAVWLSLYPQATRQMRDLVRTLVLPFTGTLIGLGEDPDITKEK